MSWKGLKPVDTTENSLDVNNPWRSLALAIVAQAARDYQRTHSEESEQFLRSGWCQLLLGNVDGKWLWNKLKQEPARGKRGRRGGATFEGKSINEWEHLLGVSHDMIRRRMYRYDMTLEEAIIATKQWIEKRGSNGADRGTDGV